MKNIITKELLEKYQIYLYEQEKSKATIQKYICDLKKLMEFADNREISKLLVIQYKEYLRKVTDYKTSSINSFLVAANRFFVLWDGLSLRLKRSNCKKRPLCRKIES